MRNLGAYKGFRGLAGKRSAPAEGCLILIYRDGVKFMEIARMRGVPEDEVIYEFRHYVDTQLNVNYKRYSDLIAKDVKYQDLLPR